MFPDLEDAHVDRATVVKLFCDRDYNNVIYEAVRFTGDNLNDLRVFLGPRLVLANNFLKDEPEIFLSDEVTEMLVRIKKGYWVLRRQKATSSRFYVWKNKPFKKTYKPVKE